MHLHTDEKSSVVASCCATLPQKQKFHFEIDFSTNFTNVQTLLSDHINLLILVLASLVASSKQCEKTNPRSRLSELVCRKFNGKSFQFQTNELGSAKRRNSWLKLNSSRMFSSHASREKRKQVQKKLPGIINRTKTSGTARANRCSIEINYWFLIDRKFIFNYYARQIKSSHNENQFLRRRV